MQYAKQFFNGCALRWPAALLVAVLGVLAAGALRPDPMVQADVTRSPQPEAFKSGGERSEVVLKEILVVLRQMDARLQKIEYATDATAKNTAIQAK